MWPIFGSQIGNVGLTSMFSSRYPRVKSTISGRLLDFAESLPEVKRGPLHHLQLVRHYQRRHAERSNASPPTGASVKLGSIRLVDAYSIEQFSGLVRSIEKLFPNSDDFGERNPAAEIDSAIRTLTGGAWWNAGQIVRERRGYILSRPYRELPDLPPQVRMIEVHVEHLMPSLAIVTFDVNLTDEGATELKTVQGRSYLGEMTLRSLLKWGRGHSERPADWVRTRAIRSWIDRLRSSVEDVLRPFVEPGLFSHNGRERPSLPAIETYLLESSGAHRDDAWEKMARAWLDSYGIGWTYQVYRSEADLFQWPKRHRHQATISSHIIVAFREQYRAVIKNPQAYGGEDRAILHYVEDGLRALMPFIVIRELLRRMGDSVQRLREQVFALVGDGASRSPFRIIRNPTTLNVELLRQSILLARLKSELAQQSRWFDHEMKAWKDLEWLPKIGSKALRLPEHASEWVAHELGLLEIHLDLARNAFAEYFTARNTRAIYWLTIAALILAIVQLATSGYIRARVIETWMALQAATSGWFQ